MSSARTSTTNHQKLALFIAIFAAVQMPARAEDGVGQTVQDSSGQTFMEEVVDMDKVRQEQAKAKEPVKVDRHIPTPEELANVGVQMSPSGSIVPLINRGAPPVMQYGTRMTVTQEPIYPIVPYYPYGGGQIYGPNGPYVVGPGGQQYYTGLGTRPRWLNTLNNINNLVNPTPYVPYVVAPPATSFSWETPLTPGAVPPSASSSVTVQQSGSMMSRPFWNGYAGTNPFGGFSGGFGGFFGGLPSVTNFQSSTTYTPILPSISP